MVNARNTDRTVVSLVGDLQSGRIDRRQFVQRGLALGLGTTFLGTVIAACGGSSSSSSSSGGSPATSGVKPVPVGVINTPGKFDPYPWQGFTSGIVNNHVYQSLMRPNFDTNKFEPALATEWDQPNPTTYTYTLRDGVTFHNGAPFTADDVVFSVNRAKKMAWGAYALAFLDSVRKRDAKTIEVKLTQPDWRFQWMFSHWPPGYMVSKAYHDKVGDAKFAEAPIGTNAFKFVSASNQQIVLERNPDYWEQGLPKLDRIEINVLDDNTTVTGFKTGAVLLSPDVGFDKLDLVKGFGDTDIKARVGPHIVLSAINTTKQPFDDIKVRQAMAEALDNAAALSAYPTTYMVPSKGAVIYKTFDSSAYDDIDGLWSGDLNKAKQMLDASSAAGGLSLDWMVTATRAQEVSAVVGAQERLGKIGIKVNVKRLPDADMATALYKRPRPFDIITYNWLHNQPHILDPLTALYASANDASTNWAGYKNPKFDKLHNEVIKQTDASKRDSTLRELQQMIAEDVPYLTHGWDAQLRVENTTLQTPTQTTLAQWDDWFRASQFSN
jgi:peptide/nickel transport system substrate-binding protein